MQIEDFLRFSIFKKVLISGLKYLIISSGFSDPAKLKMKKYHIILIVLLGMFLMTSMAMACGNFN